MDANELILVSKKLKLMDKLLDDRCDLFGIDNTICYLMDYSSLTQQEIIDLGFDEDDVNRVFADNDASIYSTQRGN